MTEVLFFRWFYRHSYGRNTFPAGSVHIHTTEVLFPLVLSTFTRQKYFSRWFYPHSHNRSTFFPAGSIHIHMTEVLFPTGSIDIHTAEILFPLVLSTFIRQKYFFRWFFQLRRSQLLTNEEQNMFESYAATHSGLAYGFRDSWLCLGFA